MIPKEASSDPMRRPIGRQGDSELPAHSSIVGFAAKVSRYFLDFLETDFKKQQAPRRRIQLKNDGGFRTALPLRKYHSLYRAVWKILSTPVGDLQPLKIAKSRHTAPISPTLRDLIRQHIDSLDSPSFQNARGETLDCARHKRGVAVENPEEYVEEVQACFVESVGKHIVSTILALLDGPFRQQSYSAIESVYEVETDLIEALTTQVVEQLPMALNTFIVSSDLGATEKVLEEFSSESEAKERVKLFFEAFATADAYQELGTHQMLPDLLLYPAFDHSKTKARMADPKVGHPAAQDRIDFLNHFLDGTADILPEDFPEFFKQRCPLLQLGRIVWPPLPLKAQHAPILKTQESETLSLFQIHHPTLVLVDHNV
jgi:hypothetical protein